MVWEVNVEMKGGLGSEGIVHREEVMEEIDEHTFFSIFSVYGDGKREDKIRIRT